MIESITLNGIATYNNEVTIEPSKINFFYGGNGTGKSTLARYITAHLNDGVGVVHTDTTGTERVVTYNRDFVEQNFRAESGLPGIFTLGQESVETRQEISQLNDQIVKLANEVESTQHSIDTINQEKSIVEGTLKESCWRVQREYGNEFADALVGFRASMDKFAQECVSVVSENETIPAIDAENLRMRYNAVYSRTAEPMALYPIIPTDSISVLNENTIVRKVITGRTDTPFGTFIEYLHAGNWVKQGTVFANAAHGKCPYCQRDLPENIQKDIEAFFDDAYQTDCNILHEFAEKYKAEKEKIVSCVKSILNGRADMMDYSPIEMLIPQLIQKLDHNLSEIERKLESPSITIELDDVLSIVNQINSHINKLNTSIQENNRLIENQQNARPQCQKEIWYFLVSQIQNEIRTSIKLINGKKKGLQNLSEQKKKKEGKIQEYRALIAEKEASLVSVEPTVSAINKLLDTFGFSGFSIDANPMRQGTYRIVRNDKTDASKTLSEGEYTFITFLYYYHLCFGSFSESGITGNKILVIDDPISSLDSTVLFVVATLVREIISKCRAGEDGITQLFILTHNVHFHKEITYLGSREHFSPDEVRYYIIRKKGDESGISLYENNPIRTSYELLWDDIKNPDRISPEGILNTMRRILEHYFQVIGGINYEKCISEFEGEEKIICKSLVAYINDGSHSIFDDVMLSLDELSVQKYLRVFKLIFSRLNHNEHYDMMMNRV